MKEQAEHRIAICIDNSDYEMSLERRKVYSVLPDADAERDDYIANRTRLSFLLQSYHRAFQRLRDQLRAERTPGSLEASSTHTDSASDDRRCRPTFIGMSWTFWLAIHLLRRLRALAPRPKWSNV